MSNNDGFAKREEIDRLLETMGLQTVIFVGNSLGGSLALLLALENPDRIALVRSLDFRILSRYDQRLPAIDIPTLLIWGEEDPWVRLPVGRRLDRDLPHSTLRIIPHCGHAPQEELPEETAGLIIDWLA